MNFQSHLQYQDVVTNTPEESITYSDSSPYNIIQGESADYCELRPVAVSSSSVMSPNVDDGIYSGSSNMDMEYRDISYIDYRDTYSTSQSSTSYDCSRSPWGSDSSHSLGAEGGLDPISQDYSRSHRSSESTNLLRAEGGPDTNFQDFNRSRSPWSSYGISDSSEDNNRSFGYAMSSPGESEVTLDELDEVLNLEGMSISPAICAPNENRPKFTSYAHTQRAKTDGSVNTSTSQEDSTMSSYAEKYLQIKEQNKRRAKKYRLQKQQNLKEIGNTLPQLEERNQTLKSEYESLKKKRDSLKILLPQLHK